MNPKNKEGKHKHTVSTIAVFPMTTLKKGSYPDVLYSILRSKYGLEIVHPQVSGLVAFFSQLIRRRPIIHIHWIEHKYTLGLAGSLDRFSKFIIVFIALIFIVALLSFKLLGCKVVTTLHNIVPHKPLLYDFEYAVFRITLCLSAVIFVHGEHAASVATKFYNLPKEKVVKIPLGNMQYLRKQTYDKSQARRVLSIDCDSFVICYVGRISPDKGLHCLLEALNGLRTHRTIYVIIAGPVADKRYLQKISHLINNLKASIKVLLHARWVSEDELSLFIEACDVGVLPYVRTTTPSSVLLFMSFGKPVIAPAFPAVRELTGDENPLLYDGTITGLRKAIEKAVLMSDLDKLGERALSRAQLFSWDRLALITYKSYLKMLKN